MANLTKKARRSLSIDRSLPRHVHAVVSRGRTYHYFQIARSTEGAGLRIKIDDPWNEAEIAQAYVLFGSPVAASDWLLQLHRTYATAKSRARVDRMEFAIDMEFLGALLNRQAHRCAVSGVYFESAGYERCHMAPFAISLDRVDCSKGYTKDNVRLVCRIANFAMGEWGLAALERLAEGISAQRRKRPFPELQL
jgi:hypothetical protein